MYGQGSYNSRFGQAANSPVPPYHHQQLPGPLPLSHFQPGSLAAPSSAIQPSPPMYQQGVPTALRQVPLAAMPNTSQSYLHPPSGSTPSHLGASNVHHMPPSALPHPPRPLPPPPPMMYRASVNLHSQQPGGVQDLQSIPLPPLPTLTSGFFTASPTGSFVQSGSGTHIPSTASLPTPPPPSCPPPISPSPPPPTSPFLSSIPHHVDSKLTCSNEPSTSKLSTSGSIVKDIAINEGKQIRDMTSNEDLNQQVSLVGDSLSSSSHEMLDLPPPPEMPKEEKVVQKIEELCQLIAKNGLDYEDMIRQTESGNPEFEFLFAGEPGSGAAIAHQYFLWMKKKYIWARKLNEEKADSPLRPSVSFSRQPDSLVVAAASISPADSDMEMEDDITQSVNDKEGNYSTEGTNNGYDFIHSELDVKKQLHAQLISIAEKVSSSSSAIPFEQGENNVSDHDQLAFERPLSKVCSQVVGPADELSSASKLKKSATLLADNKISSGASEAAEGIHTEKIYSQVIKGGSPFRLLQEYVSDDECVSPSKGSSSVAFGTRNLHGNSGCNLELDTVFKSRFKDEKGFGLRSGLSRSHKAANFPEDSGREVKHTAAAAVASGTADEHVDDKLKNQASNGHAEFQVLQKKDAPGGACLEVSLNGKGQKECEEKSAKSASNLLKVDKFGRLVREGASDSDSDDIRYHGRQNKRGRSRSRSPLDRRRRRSPRRRRDKRSRSRSCSPRNRRSRSRSPRNQRSRSRSPRNRRSRSRSPRNRRSWSRSPRRRRSRSRSPAFRHVGEFSGDGMRRDRGQIPECFDFRRGRCYRGASCRYLHHDSDKGDGQKRHRNKKQYFEFPLVPETSSIQKEKHILSKALDKEDDEVKTTEIQHHPDLPGHSSVAAKDRNMYWKNQDSINDTLYSGSFDRDCRLIDSHTIKSESSIEAATKMSETQVLEGETEVPSPRTNKSWQEATEAQHPMLVDGFTCHASQNVLPLEKPVIKQSQPHLSDPLLRNTGFPPQQTNNASISDSAPEQASKTSVNKFPVTEALQNAVNFRHHSPKLPPPPPPVSQGVTAQHVTQPPQDASFPLQSNSGEMFPSYMFPNHQSHFSITPSTSWTSLPPPPPGVSSQLQLSHLAPRNDLSSQIITRPYAKELPTHSQVGDFQHQAYPSMQEPHRSLPHTEDFRLKPLPLYNPPSQQFGRPGLLREDHLTQLPMMGTNVSSSFAQGDTQPRPTPFTLGLPAKEMQPFPADKLPSGEHLGSSSQIHPYLQQKQLPYGLHDLAAVSSSSRYPPDLQETNQSSCLPDLRGSRNSTYYNPCTSTLEQPLSSKFVSDLSKQEQDTSHGSNYAAPFGLGLPQVDGQNIGIAGPGQVTSSPNPARAVGQNFPGSGGDQYDPLIDSIDPSSNLSKKSSNAYKWEPSSDSDIMLRHSGTNRPLDVEENSKKKVVGGVEVATSVDDEEYGETADAEVGAVENESPNNPIHGANIPAGDIEIDQIKSPGKSRKSKESRSMKLFKVALADFVKEVLKPSWRQGNMSKEAFKTIVKKTVDKVSGAMKSHQIPKSRSKIDQYIDSSQRKLTKLVTGYVDKYVKM